MEFCIHKHNWWTAINSNHLHLRNTWICNMSNFRLKEIFKMPWMWHVMLSWILSWCRAVELVKWLCLMCVFIFYCIYKNNFQSLVKCKIKALPNCKSCWIFFLGFNWKSKVSSRDTSMALQGCSQCIGSYSQNSYPELWWKCYKNINSAKGW
jgi:hypothetical protein